MYHFVKQAMSTPSCKGVDAEKLHVQKQYNNCIQVSRLLLEVMGRYYRLANFMAISLLATKLRIPRQRVNSVSRPRLTEKLNTAVQRPGSVILLSGSAGFGKTTLLSEFAADRLVVWVSLGEEDNDPMQFWSYVVTAL